MPAHFYSAIADEAGLDLQTQLRAVREIGWKHLEVRVVRVEGFPEGNLHDIPDAAFDKLAGIMADSGIRVNCFASTIANWGKQIDGPTDASFDEARRAIPRMKKLGATHIRIMSYAVRKDAQGRPLPDQMKEERFKRLRELHRMFTGEGLVPLHENCMNYGGMGWSYTLELLEAVPGLKLVFDTGNPVFADDMTRPEPRPKQSAWEFYLKVRDHIDYVHIKDGVWLPAEQKTRFTYPGEGEGHVRPILKDLISRGYAGGISIEPHMGAVFHDPTVTSDEESKYRTFVEYGRRLESLVNSLTSGS
jgi:sugar phosphate isomerase/epimerase